jgi:rhamnose utilization protein RhaD (predicted bifunctional aldolase and dehydrogenase)
MTVTNSLSDSVIDYCAKIGSDSMLVQGAGGNVSWKDGDTLWVKASGAWLADAKVKDIFVPVDLSELQKEIKAGNFAVTPKVKGDSKLRPSIETLLHALMPHRVVVHVHAIEALAYLVRENAENQINEKLASLFEYVIVDYQKPGEALAQAIGQGLLKSTNAQVVLLKNHGVVIGGDSVAEVKAALSSLIAALSLRPLVIVNTQPVLAELHLKNGVKYKPVELTEIQNLVFDAALFEKLKTAWALYPDHVVFLGHQAVCYESVDQLENEFNINSTGDLIFIKGLGVYTKVALSASKQAQLKCYYDVISRQTNQVALMPLNQQQIGQLLDWDAEQYRQQISK